jgi:hypothetical protein
LAPHAVGQQARPPLPSVMHWPLAHSPAAVQVCPFASLGRQVPLKHHWPARHESPAGQFPQVVALSQ